MWPAIIIGAVAVGAVLLASWMGWIGNPVGALTDNPGVPGWLMVPRGLITGNQLRLIHWLHWRGLIQGDVRLKTAILPWVKKRGAKNLILHRTTMLQEQPSESPHYRGGAVPPEFAPYVSAQSAVEPTWPNVPAPTVAGGGGGVTGLGAAYTPTMPNALHGSDLGLWVWPPSVWGDGDRSAADEHVAAWLAHWEACMWGRTHPALTLRKQYMASVDMAIGETYAGSPGYRVAMPGFNSVKVAKSSETWAPHDVTAENVAACYLWTCSYLASIGLLNGPANLPAGPQNADVNQQITSWLAKVKSSAEIKVKPSAPSGQVKALAKGFGLVIGTAKGAKRGSIMGTGIALGTKLVVQIVELFDALSRGRVGKVAWHDDWTPVWIHHSVMSSAVDPHVCLPMVEYEGQGSGGEFGVGGVLETCEIKPVGSASGTSVVGGGAVVGSASGTSVVGGGAVAWKKIGS